MKLKNPELAPYILDYLGIDKLNGKYLFANGNLIIDNYTDADISLAEKKVFTFYLKNVKYNSQQKVLDYALSIEKELTSGYTPGEIASWPAKLDAAYAYKDNVAKPAQIKMIESEAAEKNINPITLCDTIITKGEWYAEATALIAGLRSKTFNAIDNATSEAEIDTILQNALTYANQKWVDLISRMP